MGCAKRQTGDRESKGSGLLRVEARKTAEGWQLSSLEGAALPAGLDVALSDVAAEGAVVATAVVGATWRGDRRQAVDWRCVGLDAGMCRWSTSVSWSVAGTEPFWELSVDEAGLATWSTPDSPGPTSLGTVNPASKSWRLEHADGEVWTVTLTHSPCSDGMSDALYAWAAVVTMPSGGSLHGCGFDVRPPR